jgi:hypothetical protein
MSLGESPGELLPMSSLSVIKLLRPIQIAVERGEPLSSCANVGLLHG